MKQHPVKILSNFANPSKREEQKTTENSVVSDYSNLLFFMISRFLTVPTGAIFMFLFPFEK